MDTATAAASVPELRARLRRLTEERGSVGVELGRAREAWQARIDGELDASKESQRVRAFQQQVDDLDEVIRHVHGRLGAAEQHEQQVTRQAQADGATDALEAAIGADREASAALAQVAEQVLVDAARLVDRGQQAALAAQQAQAALASAYHAARNACSAAGRPEPVEPRSHLDATLRESTDAARLWHSRRNPLEVAQALIVGIRPRLAAKGRS